MIQELFWSRFWQVALAAGWRVSQLPGLWRWFQVQAGYNPAAHAGIPGGVRGQRLRAADLWASIDGKDPDGLSIDELGVPDFRYPEPGGRCLDAVATIQLYWPAVKPWAVDAPGYKRAYGRGAEWPLFAGGELEDDR